MDCVAFCTSGSAQPHIRPGVPCAFASAVGRADDGGRDHEFAVGDGVFELVVGMHQGGDAADVIGRV